MEYSGGKETNWKLRAFQRPCEVPREWAKSSVKPLHMTAVGGKELKANLVHFIAMPMARANRHSNFSIHLKYKFRNKLAAPERF